ncbi:hypothetical protein EHI47_31245 [Rhizobium leguminosarum]|jgi:hypothetical protein|uniref:Uncharacterized protein n=2 Tax=Rhizobium TaxID=379 RepID=A0A444HME0_RHILE|nr:hypothetical protein EHI47_31245 [Rhizobium leguminosarum]TAU51526.1 hypothetical protein ELI43_01135 [Rhizobium leguminosarum]TBC71587.1 hypothetical protein ELH27_01320 [Rhizobium leguminosarum]TBE69483.1 hypothetical protein ELH03_01200 [Rhizobium beringeri]
MPQGFFQFCLRLSQNLKKAGLCPDISIRASGESSAIDLSANLMANHGADRKPLATISQYGAHSNGDVTRNRPAGAVIIRGRL